MSSPQAIAPPDSSTQSTEPAAAPKQAIDADLNIAACNGDENRNEEEHEYRVGDLVWAKIKSHPWWPGRIHDPKDASESAARPDPEGRLLVAFFGDGSFSWCLPSQLMPFVENFSRGSKDGSSRSFVNAVNGALDEVSRVVNSYMACGCVSTETRPAVDNAGIREGVLVPEADAARLSLPDYEASDVYSKLGNFAKNVPSDGILDIGVVRGWLSAFRRSKGLGKLQEYREPFYIEGLEDRSSEDEGVSDDISVPIRGPHEDEEEEEEDDGGGGGPSSPELSAVADNKPRRRRKSVNDIMAESASLSPKRRKRVPISDNDGKKTEKGKFKESGEAGSGAARSGDGNSKQRQKTVEAADTKKNGKGKKVKGSESPEAAEEVGSKRKPEKIESVEAEDRVGEEGGDVAILSPRERKKSKYLSNPYVEPLGRVGSSSFKKALEASKEAITDGNVITTEPVDDLDITLSSLKSKVESPKAKPAKIGSPEKAKSREPESPKAAVKKGKGKTESSEKSRAKEEPEGSERASVVAASYDALAEMNLIRNKLEITDAILRAYYGKFKEADKESLKADLRSLAERVEAFRERVNEMAQGTKLSEKTGD